jgi:serine/threonine protein kinase
VEVVETSQGPVVRKTFARAYVRHMNRELQALRELRAHVDAVPDLLDTGPNWFTCPYYRDVLGDVWASGRLLPLRVVREMVDVLRSIHQHGFDLIDAKPQNFVLDPRRGLKVVDFEFLHQYSGEPPDFTSAYSFVGVPEGFSGDVPVNGFSYDHDWHRFTGLPFKSLVGEPPLAQHARRTMFRLRRSVTGPRAPARQGARLVRQKVRQARGQAARTYTTWTKRRAVNSHAGQRAP